MNGETTLAPRRAVGAVPQRMHLYAPPPNLSKPIRVTLVAPWRLPAWLVEFIDLAAESTWLDLVVLPVHGASLPATPVPPDLRALLAYERRRRRTDTAFALLDLARCEGIEIEPVEPAVGSSTELKQLQDRVASLRPDLVLLLGPDDWTESMADGAQWGCWNIDASLVDADAAAQALATPVMRGESATAVGLELLQAGSPPDTLAQSWSTTARAAVGLQRQYAFEKMPALLLRALRRLAAGDLPTRRQRSAKLRLARAAGYQGVGMGAGAFASTMEFRLRERWRHRRQTSEAPWFVLLRHAAEALKPEAPVIRRTSTLEPPADHFWADPCIVKDEGRNILFVEQWASGDSKGVIACLELLPEGQVRRLGLALDLPFHLSYPQVFQADGDWFMTTESGQARCVSLYRATAFPLGWEHVTTLLKGWPCVDPTLHFHEGRWYLFVSVAESGRSACDDLFVFVADRLTGPFQPHPANPIVADVRKARMAGRLFNHGGRLIRPGQDCAPSYGAAIVFNEVLELSPTRYRERTLGRLDSSWASTLDGCHTYSAVDGCEVLDARGVPRPDPVRAKVRSPPEWTARPDVGAARPVSTLLPGLDRHSIGSMRVRGHVDLD